MPDAGADESQGGQSDGGGHAADLPVFAFGELQGNPRIGDGFANADRRGPRRPWGSGIDPSGDGGLGAMPLDDDAMFECGEVFQRGHTFDLHVIFAWVRAAGVEQAICPDSFVAEQQQPFRIAIQPSNRIDSSGKATSGQRLLSGMIRRKLGKHVVGFMKSDQHRVEAGKKAFSNR